MGYIDKIIQIAQSYKGQEEIQPNLGFKDPSFEIKMKLVGFYSGASWCGFYVMLVLFEAFGDDPVNLALLKKYCSASTYQMWLNFKASKEFITGMIPKPGGIAIYQEGTTTSGHTGLIINVNNDLVHYTLSEGNSNSNGSRNGYEVAENVHATNKPHSITGLNLLGFVYLPD